MSDTAQTAETAPVGPKGGENTQHAISAQPGAGNALYNCCTNSEEPDWSRFDGIEIGGCCNDADTDTDETCICGGYNVDEAEFFTVYGHLIEGGVEAITDVLTFEQAQTIATLFARQHGFEIHVTC